MNPALLSSKKMDWRTPPDVLRLVEQVAPIGLDPCPANWDGSFDGLEIDWSGRGLVFVNPPYGRAIPNWVHKACSYDWNYTRDDSLIMLVPSRTDTAWFDRLAARANGLCFWKGRMRFVGAEHPAPFPTLLAYFGRYRGAFDDAFCRHGNLMSKQ